MAQTQTTNEKTKASNHATKAAFEQFAYNPELVNQFAQANEKVVDGTLEAANITFDALKQINRKQVEFVGALFDISRRQLDLLSASKDPATLGGLQTQLGEAMLAQWSEYFNAVPQIGVEASKRYGKVISDMMAVGSKAAA